MGLRVVLTARRRRQVTENIALDKEVRLGLGRSKVRSLGLFSLVLFTLGLFVAPFFPPYLF